jgi:hypothetical protein
LSGQNQAPGTPEENATLHQSQEHWKDALAFARAIVSTALAFAVVAQDHGNMNATYLKEFAMQCTDFLIFIHSLCPHESPRALKGKWPPEWLDTNNTALNKEWTRFCLHVRGGRDDSDYSDHPDHSDHPNHPNNPSKLLKASQPASNLKSNIEERLHEYSSWKGGRLKIPASTLLIRHERILEIAA